MADSHVVAAEEDENDKSDFKIRLSGDFGFNRPAEHESLDPFNAPLRELRKLDGLSTSVKRKLGYEISKEEQPSVIDTAVGNGMEGRQGAKSKQLPEIFYTGYSVFDVATPPHDLSYLAQLYEISTYNYAAINAKVANAVGLGYGWVESPKASDILDGITDAKRLNKMRRKIQQLKTDMDTWLDSLNDEALFVETMVRVYTDYQSTGNGYLEIGRTANGQIGYLGHIPSVSMRVRTKRDGYVQIIGNRVVFFQNYGTPDKIADPIGTDANPNEVIHFKNYTPTNSYYGVPDIVSALSAVAGNEFASRYNLEYFENKAVPRHLVVLKGATLGVSQERRLMEFFEVGLRGKSHRTLFIPLPADSPDKKIDFKIEPVEDKVQDGSFDKYRTANRDDILMAHRVPISKIGIPDGIQLAIAAVADKTFKEQVSGPDQAVLQKKINKVIAEKTDVLTLKLNELTLTDENTQSQMDERDIRNQIKVPNEIRADRGLPGYEGGDKPIDPHPPTVANQNENANGNSARARERSNAQPDNQSTGRKPKGEGRSAP